MTLPELLIAIVLSTLVIGGASQYFIAQTRTYRRGANDTAMLQNVRFVTDLLYQHVRSAGVNVSPGQPSIIYADPTVFAFNADYSTNVAGDNMSVYYTPYAPDSEVQGLTVAKQITLPRTSYIYPTVDYGPGPGVPPFAETITFYFAVDSTNSKVPGAYALWRQVNSATPEALVRNVMPDTVPFFRYQYLLQNGLGNDSLAPVDSAHLPISYADTSAGDISAEAVRIVELHFLVANGLTGAAQRVQRVSLTASLPNVGKPQLPVCGSQPIFGQSLTATQGAPGSGQIQLSWNPATDETGGQRDIMRYVIWRKQPSDSSWGDPVLSVPAPTLTPPYAAVDNTGAPAGTPFVYAISAQDCTPQFSVPAISNQVNVP